MARSKARRSWLRTLVLTALLSLLLAAGGAAAWFLFGPTTLSVESSPPGATVKLDGEAIGETPLEAYSLWPPRAVRVEVEKAGRGSEVRHLAASPGVRVEMRFLLPPDPREPEVSGPAPRPAVLTVVSSPPGAEVILDGEPSGRKTSEEGEIELAPGFYTVSVSLEGYRSPEPVSVHLEPGERERIHFTLVPSTGYLSIVSDPSGASVRIDGQDAGRTPVEKHPLEEGEHEVLVALEGYRTRLEERFFVPGGRLRQLFALLEPVAGRVRIQTEPLGMRVLVWGTGRPGERTLESPFEGELPAGSYRVRIEDSTHLDHLPLESSIDVLPDRTSAFRFHPIPYWREGWDSPVGAPLSEPPVLADIDRDGNLEVVVSDRAGRLAVLDSQGELLARFEIGSGAATAAAAAEIDGDGYLDLVAGSEDGRLAIVSGRTGRVARRLEIPGGGAVVSHPVLADLDGDLVPDAVVAHGESVSALSLLTGEVLWTAGVQAAVTGGPVLLADAGGDGVPEFALAATDGNLRVLSGRDGSVLWEGHDGEEGVTPAAVASSAGTQWVVGTEAGGTLAAYIPADGTLAWSAAIRPGGPGCLSAGEGYVLVARGAEGVSRLDPASGEIIWTFVPPSGPASPFLVAPVLADADGDGDPDVLAATAPGDLYALDGESGERIWSLSARGGLAAPAAAADLDGDGLLDVVLASAAGWAYARPVEPLGGHRVFATGVPTGGEGITLAGLFVFGARDGQVRAIDALTGEERWTLSTGGEVYAAPLPAGDFLAIGSFDRVLRLVRPEDGSVVWEREQVGRIYGLASPGDVNGDTDSDVIVVTDEGVVSARDGSTGGEIWTWRAGSPVRAAPAFAPASDTVPGLVVFGSEGGRLVALRAASGEAHWQVDVGEPVEATPVFVEIGGTPEVVFATRGGRVASRILADGGAGGVEFRAPDAVTGRPAVVRNPRALLVAGAGDGSLLAWNLEGKAPAWRTAPGGPIVAGPAVVEEGAGDGEDLLLVPDREGRVHLVGANDGRILGSHPVPPGVVATPHPLPGGTQALVLAADGAVHLFPIRRPLPGAGADTSALPFTRDELRRRGIAGIAGTREEAARDLARAIAAGAVDPAAVAALAATDPASLRAALVEAALKNVPLERLLVSIVLSGGKIDHPGPLVAVPLLGPYLAGRFDEVAAVAETLLEDDPADPDRLLALALCRAAQGRTGEAVALARGVTAPSPESRELLEEWSRSLR
ncbi:MAG: PQQ-binding-like beta-propeller repeat protein [Planctomycetes bacterium]|nr:PQQ-binding-like beta-propeller repeat protein [Planctomycetota bacterium]